MSLSQRKRQRSLFFPVFHTLLNYRDAALLASHPKQHSDQRSLTGTAVSVMVAMLATLNTEQTAMRL